jgi:general secretion pathway protein D
MKIRQALVAAAFAMLLLAGGCAHQSTSTRSAKPAQASEPAPTSGPDGNNAGASVPAPQGPTVLRGTGNLTAPAAPPEQHAPPAAGSGYQLSFVDTDIATIIATVLGDGLNLPYIIDPQLKGTLTLQATRALSRDELFAALESALRVQGIALVDVDGVYRVVPSKDATRRVTGLRAPGQGTLGFGIYVVPLRFVSASEMEKVLQPFAPDGGIVRVDEGRNLLLLAGTSAEISTLLNVVNTFDVDWLEGMSFALFPLEYVDAKIIAGELSQVFSGERNPIAGVVRFVPLVRLNSLMVITPQPKYLQDVDVWIKKLDIGATTAGRRIYVYDVQNGKADDLARSLNRILSLSGGTDTDAALLDTANSTMSGSTSASRGFASPLNSTRPTLGGPFQSLAPQVTAQAPIISGFGPQALSPTQALASPVVRDEATALQSGVLKIVPNSENNALLILASPSEYSVIEAALKRLDTVPIQVLIEASIAEVALTDEMSYGLQWSYLSGDGPLVFSDTPGGTVNSEFPGFSYLYTGRSDIRAVLNAIQSLTNVRVLSSPKLMVLNNREAQLQVGDQVPITVQSAVSTVDTTAPIVNSVQFRDTGVILHVTPRANKSGRVTLEVAQEVSDVTRTTSSGIDSPTIQQRKLSSVVTVHDGDTIALGGLIRESSSTGGSGLPYLRKIPILGHLFGTTNNDKRRTELIILLTPRVIRSQDEAHEAMNELRDEFRGLRKALPVWKQDAESTNPPGKGGSADRQHDASAPK